MKVVILAGGYGTRISEETHSVPKPMIEIGGKPVLWHIMKLYSQHGFNEFIILCGYKGYVIKEYFANYFLHQSNVTIDLKNNEMEIHNNSSENWKVTLLDTGLDTMTGGRIKRAETFIGDEPFMLTYGDGVADIDFGELVRFHKSHGKAVTLTSVQPDGRFGAISIKDAGKITNFQEKPIGDGAWVNAGFFVCEPKVFEYLQDGDSTIFEQQPMNQLVAMDELYAYQHKGFWKCMDTLRDKVLLGELWDSGKAPWKTWN